MLVHVDVPELHAAVHGHLHAEVHRARGVQHERVPADAEKLKRLLEPVVREVLGQEKVGRHPDSLSRQPAANELVERRVIDVGKRKRVRVPGVGRLVRRRVRRDGFRERRHGRVRR